MFGTTSQDKRFERIENAMDLAGHSLALEILINYAGYSDELFDWLEREYDIDTEDDSDADIDELDDDLAPDTTQDLLETMVKGIATRLSAGWTYEEDENGEYCDDDGYPTSPHEFISDALDIEYTIDSEGRYTGAKMWTTVGGPTIWVEIDGHHGDHGYIYGTWGGDKAEAFYSDGGALCDAVEELFTATIGHRYH